MYIRGIGLVGADQDDDFLASFFNWELSGTPCTDLRLARLNGMSAPSDYTRACELFDIPAIEKVIGSD